MVAPMRDRQRLFILLAVILAGSPFLAVFRQQLPPPHMLPERWQWLHRLNLDALSVALPSMSPFLVGGGLLAGHAAGLASCLAAVTLLFAILRGRWFCRNVCPVGWLNDRVGRWNRRGADRLRRFPNVGPWLLWIGLGGALAGYPFFLWLDPLSLLNGFLNFWRIPFSAHSLVFGLGLLGILALSLICPGSWCFRLCPLGAAQEGLGRLGRRLRRFHERDKPPTEAACAQAEGFTRRVFLALGGGIIAGGLIRIAGRWFGGESGRVIRPPGAVPEDQFKAMCARCGNCMRACPQRIIHAAGTEAGWDGMFTPVLRIRPGYCAEFCHQCNQVCPTLAIRRLVLDQKRKTAIALARVEPSACIAWAGGQYCMVCDEHCPYKAIGSEEHAGVPCPVVREDRCRGCGMCETVCPGNGPAIRVEGIQPQRHLAD